MYTKLNESLNAILLQILKNNKTVAGNALFFYAVVPFFKYFFQCMQVSAFHSIFVSGLVLRYPFTAFPVSDAQLRCSFISVYSFVFPDTEIRSWTSTYVTADDRPKHVIVLLLLEIFH
jgi:hypothetical protein